MDPSPFTFADADAILRTSDGISFKIHQPILKYASSYFSKLYPSPYESTLGLRCDDVPESSKVMHMLLMLIYPMEDPQICALSLLSDVLWAAQRYSMVQAIQSLRRLLVSPQFIQKTPLLVYAVASRHNLEAEMKAASKESLGTNIMAAPLAEELKYMTAYDYQRLLNLHHRRGVEARNLISWKRQSADSPGKQTNCESCGSGKVPQWWREFSWNANAVLYETPTTSRIFTMEFLADIEAVVECPQCMVNLSHKSYSRLEEIKRDIDALPDTV